jgi:hypothetical protein
MKKLLVVMLALHVLMEGGVGLVLTFAPTMIAPDLAPQYLAYLVNYGCAGITMAIVVLWFWPHRHNVLFLGLLLGILASFHSAEALAGILVAYRSGNVNVLITHGLFAILFWALWSKRNTLATAK